MNPAEAAAKLKTEPSVLLQLTDRGAVPAIELRSGWRFRAEELDHFIVASGLYRDPSLADRTLRSRLARWRHDENLRGWSVPPDLNAEAEQVPGWARQGHLRFARFDGGVLHHAKAVLSGWQPSGFTRQIAALARDAYHPAQLAAIADALRDAGITAAWVSWSLGFSLEHERQQFDQCRRAIAALHERGIKAFAYLSCNNFFWEEAAQRDPAAADMTLCEGGVHLTYEHSPHRRLANLRHPGWWEITQARLRAAIEAGVDGLFYDNCESPTEDLAYFLPRLRRFLRVELGSRVPLMLNLHLYHRPQNFALADLVDIIYNEWGFAHSGVDDAGGWNVTTVRNPIRYIAGTWPNRPMYYEMPRSMTNVIRPRAQKLHTFEAAAFGGQVGRYIEGYASAGLLGGAGEVRAGWDAIGQAHRFIDAHRELYADAQSAARIAVGVYGPNWCDRFLDELTRQSLLYDIIDLRRIDRVPLDRYRLVLIPGGLESPDIGAARTLSKFRAGGGKVIVISDRPDAFGDSADEIWPDATVGDLWRRSAPLASPRLNAEHAMRLRDRLTNIAGPPTLSVAGEYVLANLTCARSSSPAESRHVLHVLNYHNLPATDVCVTLDLPPSSGSVLRAEAGVLSPDERPPDVRSLRVDAHALRVEFASLDQYAVVPLDFRSTGGMG